MNQEDDQKPSPACGRGLGEGVKTQTSLPRRLLLTLPAILTTKAQAQPCDRIPITTLRLRLVDGYPIISATISGAPVSLLLDTGAQAMLVTPEIAAALNLPLAGMSRVTGTGGVSVPARLVRLPALRLNDALMPDQLAPIAPLPIPLAVTPPLAGLLGASLLARFDLELDIPAARLILWSPAACPAPFQGTVLPLEVSRAGEPYLKVTIEGTLLTALLDTGSRATILTQQAARRLGLAAPTSANTAPGIDGERLPLQHLRVRMALGHEPPTDTPISIAPISIAPADMLLGLDALQSRRIWIGYASRQLTLGPPAR